jgi:hypothetical protein
VPGYLEKEGGESTYTERIVSGDRDVMFTTLQRGKPQMTSGLPGHFVAKAA